MTTDWTLLQVIGTVAYMAPELFCNRRAYCSADIYSLGVTAWHLLGGKAPYVNDSTDAIIYQVVSQQRRPQPELPPPLSRWQHIIENCWHQCPDERLTAKQLANQLQHGRDSTINISKLTFHNWSDLHESIPTDPIRRELIPTDPNQTWIAAAVMTSIEKLPAVQTFPVFKINKFPKIHVNTFITA